MVFAPSLFSPDTHLTGSVCRVNSRGSLEGGAPRGGDQLWDEGCRAAFSLEVKVFNVWGSGMYLEMFPIFFYCKQCLMKVWQKTQEAATNKSPAFIF